MASDQDIQRLADDGNPLAACEVRPCDCRRCNACALWDACQRPESRYRRHRDDDPAYYPNGIPGQASSDAIPE